MGIKELLLQENEHEGKSTKRMLENCKQADPNWKPHDKSMSTFALAKHIAALYLRIGTAFGEDTFNFATAKKLEATTLEELVTAVDKGIAANEAFIKNTDEDFWSKNFTVKAGDYVIIEAPKAVVARFIILNHLIHHRGQLSVYLRMQNIPVPGMYGPSADEK